MDQKDNLDRFLDQSLSSLSDATPRDGLEQRILANLAAKEAQRSSWRWLWISIPALAALILFAVLLGPKMGHKKVTVVIEANPQEMRISRPSQATIAQTRPRTVKTVRITPDLKVRLDQMPTNAKAQPRLATFPSPDEDQQQARMLLRFVVGHPAEANEVVRDDQQFQQLAQLSVKRNSENESEK